MKMVQIHKLDYEAETKILHIDGLDGNGKTVRVSINTSDPNIFATYVMAAVFEAGEIEAPRALQADRVAFDIHQAGEDGIASLSFSFKVDRANIAYSMDLSKETNLSAIAGHLEALLAEMNQSGGEATKH